MKNNVEKILVKCFGCGKVVEESNSYEVYDKKTGDSVRLCYHCRIYGCKGCIVCAGCGGSTFPCLVKSEEVFETVGNDYNSDALACKDFRDNYCYCEECGRYYSTDYACCPDCHYEDCKGW